MKKIIASLLIFLFAGHLIAQVSIAPTSLFIDSKRRFETLVVMNPSDVAQEVRLSWIFGYPDSDENGNVSMAYGDSIPGQEYSAAEWIRGFPRNFILEPGSRQTVRVTVKAPRNISSGTYWTRLKTLSSALSPPIGVPTQPDGISAQISLQFNQITSVFYSTGDLNCGIKINDIKSASDDNKVKIVVGLEKSGNSPFLGRMQIKVYDVLGDVVIEEESFQSIYMDGWRKIELATGDLPMGAYDFEVSFSSGRSDIPSHRIVPIETVSARGSFTKL